jgi:hypothetical protein
VSSYYNNTGGRINETNPGKKLLIIKGDAGFKNVSPGAFTEKSLLSHLKLKQNKNML